MKTFWAFGLAVLTAGECQGLTISERVSLFAREGDSVFESTIAARLGEMLTGRVIYYTFCNEDHGRAEVQINGLTVWRRDTGDLPPQIVLPNDDDKYYPWEFVRVGQWESWEYVVPSDGVYTVTYAILGACQFSAYGVFDPVQIQLVPDSPPGFALLCGVIGLIGSGKRLAFLTGKLLSQERAKRP